MNYPNQKDNPARQALTRAVDRAIAAGAPVYVNDPAPKPLATMTEDELREAIAVIRAKSRPLYLQLEAFSDAELVGSGRIYSPCADVRAINAQLKPLEQSIGNLQVELNDRERQRLNSIAWDRKAAAIAAAPVYQKRNGWEIVRLDSTMPVYNLRDPATKEEVYTGCLRRCREVADDSKPTVSAVTHRFDNEC